jgi:hypothetical protein
LIPVRLWDGARAAEDAARIDHALAASLHFDVRLDDELGPAVIATLDAPRGRVVLQSAV